MAQHRTSTTTDQLALLPPSRWRLDDETRRIGREGLARARAALATARSPEPRAEVSTAGIEVHPPTVTGGHDLDPQSQLELAA